MSRFVLCFLCAVAMPYGPMAGSMVVDAQAVELRGIEFTPVGEATLSLIGTPEFGVLRVENISSEGLDGVLASVPGACSFFARWDDLPSPSTGDVLQFRVRGPWEGSPDQELAAVRFAATGPLVELSTAFEPAGTFLSSIRIRNGFSTVYSSAIADTGRVATFAFWPREVSVETTCSDAIAATIEFSFDAAVSVSVAGGPTVFATSISFDSAVLSSDLSSFHVEAAGLTSIDLTDAASGVRTSSSADSPRRRSSSIVGVAPNPFNPRTEIRYRLSRSGPVDLVLVDSSGRVVRRLWSGHRDAGDHAIVWDGRSDAGRDVASGIYFVRLTAGEETGGRPIALVR